jgi:glycosyltransferase involved in cell wall biosynthesis
VTEPPRVVQLALSLNPGGTERLVIDLATRLRDEVATTVCCLDEAGAWAPELTGRGIEVAALHRGVGFRPGLGRRIARIADAHRATVLHCHHYSPFVYGQIAALLRRRLRVVFTEHGRLSDAPPSRKRRFANRCLGRLPGALFAVSHDLRRHMIAEGLPASRLGVIHNGIEPGPRPGEAERLAARAALGIAPDRLVVGTVARLDPVKDLATLVAAFAALRERRPSGPGAPLLVIVGEGPERPRLEAAAAAAGLADAVRLPGRRDDARRLLAALDLYANTSTSEGISLTILEAMAAGLPVVATRVGGSPEVVVDGETGRLVPARDPGAVAAALVELAGARERARALGEAGRRRVEARFTIERMLRRYLAAYRGEPVEEET